VENCRGAGAGPPPRTLTRVGDVPLTEGTVAHPGDDAAAVLARVTAAGHGHAIVVDDRRRPIQRLSRRQLERLGTVTATADPRLPLVSARATLNDALDTMLVSSAGAAIVTGRRDVFQGVIDVTTIMEAITAAHESAAGESSDAPIGINTSSVPIQAPGGAAPAAAPGDEVSP
jgi:osmoprotectant transport system ATP-binding protein